MTLDKILKFNLSIIYYLIKCILPPSHILLFPALTYPLPCVHTVILNISVAGVWTLIAVVPVDGSGE